MPDELSPLRGPLALVGGNEWNGSPVFVHELLERSDGDVLVLPTAAAYERPDQVVIAASDWFGALGATVRPLSVLSRPDAENGQFADEVRAARFVYLTGGSPLHLRSVLKDSLVFHALVSAWHDGAVVAGSAAGAAVLTDPMVDPRGGAFTVGLGLVRNVSVVSHYRTEALAGLKRTLALLPSDCALVAVGEQTAVIREPDGIWKSLGSGEVTVFVGGDSAGLEALAGKPVA